MGKFKTKEDYKAWKEAQKVGGTPEEKYRKSLSTFFIILFILIGIGIMGSFIEDPPPTPPPIPTTVKTSPVLEIQTWRWYTEYDYARVEGTVKNISNKKLKNVEVVVLFYDSSGKFITSGSSLIKYNPILPGQISPFKALTTYNPEMKSANIDFKDLLGGSLFWRKLKE